MVSITLQRDISCYIIPARVSVKGLEFLPVIFKPCGLVTVLMDCLQPLLL